MSNRTKRRKVTRPVAGGRTQSLHTAGITRLSAICRALEVSADLSAQATNVFDLLTQPWNELPVGEEPPWSNDISDDGSPFEFSLAFGGGQSPRLRMLAEAQRLPISADSSWQAGLALAQRLKPQADLTRFEAVSDLFAPTRPFKPRFGLWFAAALSEGGATLFKAYFNAQILGPGVAARLVEQAFSRLGLGQAWRFLEPRLSDTTLESRIPFFSLDLEPSENARVKVYVAQSTSAGDIERMIDGSANLERGDATDWLRRLTGGDGPFQERPILTGFAFRPGKPKPDVTLHVPIRAYVRDDAEAFERAALLLSPADSDRLRRVAAALTTRPLRDGRGLLTYLSIWRRPNGLGANVYLSPELYSVTPPRSTTHAPASAGSESAPRIKVDVSRSATMVDVQGVIARQRELFATNAFLRYLEGSGRIEQVRALVPRMAFYVMCFQDVLRLARQGCRSSRLGPIIGSVEREDRGHDLWYLADLERLGVPCSVERIFSPDHAITRDTAFSIIAEVLLAKSDCTRLAVTQCLEAIGAEFFGRMIGFLERINFGEDLKYFALRHQMAEERHELFEEKTRHVLASIEVSDEEAAEVLAAIDRTFAAMTVLAKDLEASLLRSEPSSPT